VSPALWRRCRVAYVGLAFLSAQGAAQQPAGWAPAWWTQRGVLEPNAQADDYAVANSGQLKNIATQAYQELLAHLPGGAGDMTPGATGYLLTQVVIGWQSPTQATDDFSVINLGQLKAVAQPFYQRLVEVGYCNALPWNGTADNYAVANLGQLKNLFNFDLTYPGPDGGPPAWWQNYYFGTTGIDFNALAPSGDGMTIMQKFLSGASPYLYVANPPQLGSSLVGLQVSGFVTP